MRDETHLQKRKTQKPENKFVLSVLVPVKSVMSVRYGEELKVRGCGVQEEEEGGDGNKTG